MSRNQSFSERMKVGPQRIGLQVDSLDAGTRARLWNALRKHIRVTREDLWSMDSRVLGTFDNRHFRDLAYSYYDVVFKRSRTAVANANNPAALLKELEGLICGASTWGNIFDLLEFFAAAEGRSVSEWTDPTVFVGLASELNQVLADELVGWRLVNNQFVPVTDSAEIAELQTSLTSPAETVAGHFRDAAAKLADRDAKDFSQAVAAAISGVEAAAKLVTGKQSDVLTGMLQTLQAKHGTHPQLIDVFKKMYNWTSNAGIRHGKKEGDPSVDRDLAKCIIVMCSAFANLLVSSQAS